LKKPTLLADVMEGADELIVIVLKNGQMFLNYSEGLDSYTTLDILSFVTSELYETASEDAPPLH
tara:strand:+ start:1491 stop:1682 length:192 start_codon:yes stop_codon:yes gene_type:complete